MRDLSRVGPWQKPVERSPARGRLPAGTARYSRMLAACGRGLLALVLAAATVSALFAGVAGGGAGAAVTRAYASAFQLPASASYGGPNYSAPPILPVRSGGQCRPVVAIAGYFNPLARAHVTPERIDQGVDYAGSGTLAAIGEGKLVRIAMSGSGWPGTFIEYRLLAGLDSGCYVYYAEGVDPVPGLHVGMTVRAGKPIATIISGFPTGIEIGWGSGNQTDTYAARMGQWNPERDADNIPSASGRSFSALIEALGGPPGKVEG